MEINKVNKEKNTYTTNPEGSIVNSRIPEIQLYLESSNLKIKSDSFYTSANDKLQSVINQTNSLKNYDYTLNLAKYLADCGIKLSPVVLLSGLSNQGYSFRDKNTSYIFNTPQRIAEAIALQDNNYLHLNNSFKENVLKVALEKFNPYTLKKNKMPNRKIKLKDLIKLLRPKPSSIEMSKLYKAIIEDSKEAKFTDDLVRVKSDIEMGDDEKVQYIMLNIEKLPINQIIRNLKFIEEKCNFKQLEAVKKLLYARLEGFTNYRMLNIFDLITASCYTSEFGKLINDLIIKYVNNIKEKVGLDNEEATILFDTSGSMDGEPTELGYKYIVLFSKLFDISQMFVFSNNLDSDNDIDEVLTLIEKGKIKEGFVQMKAVQSNHSGGTALLDSCKEMIRNHEVSKNIIIISDEVSWIEGRDLSYDIKQLQEDLKTYKVILINPKVYSGTVFSKNLVSIGSITPTVISDVLINVDSRKFINFIMNYETSNTVKVYNTVKPKKTITKKRTVKRKK